MNKTINNFQQFILLEQLKDDQYYLFDGPDDNKNRTFCQYLVGKVVTKNMLKQMTNKDGNNPIQFIEGKPILGGYGCRHRLIPITTDQIMKYGWKIATKNDYVYANNGQPLSKTLTQPEEPQQQVFPRPVDRYRSQLKKPQKYRYRSNPERARRRIEDYY